VDLYHQEYALSLSDHKVENEDSLGAAFVGHRCIASDGIDGEVEVLCHSHGTDSSHDDGLHHCIDHEGSVRTRNRHYSGNTYSYHTFCCFSKCQSISWLNLFYKQIKIY